MEVELETKYGLPAEVKFCKRCLISNQRPVSAVEYSHTKTSLKTTIHFDAEGVCDGCRVWESKRKTIDWKARDKELKDLCDRFRRKDGSFDCVVPGSGGKDSFYASHVLKHRYGMHPLTVTWAPNIYTDWGWRNFQSWIHAGFNNYLCTPDGSVHRLLTRLAVENLFHPFQPFIIGQKALAPRLAAAFKIPLIFYGENEAEYGNPKITMDKAVQDWKYYTSPDRSTVCIGGARVDELMQNYGLTENDLQIYMPSDPKEIKANGIEVHYLGYYLHWHQQSTYYYAVENSGFQAAPERTAGTYSKYSSIDDRIDDFHYYTTFVKFGYGRATVDASQEIRGGDITREEGISLVQRYDGEFPERFAEEIFRYLSITPKEYPQASRMFKHPLMTRDYFEVLTDQARSPHLWKKEGKEWKLRHVAWQEEKAND